MLGFLALIAVGTSVCGASAIVATNTVTRGSEEDTAYAIACITLFGSWPCLPSRLPPAFSTDNLRALGGRHHARGRAGRRRGVPGRQ